MSYEEEFEISMDDIEDEDKPKICVKRVPRTYLMREGGWGTDVDEDKNEQDVKVVMKDAAKRAVKSSDGLVYVYQLIAKVEQTNYEALVKAEAIQAPVLDSSVLIEADGNV